MRRLHHDLKGDGAATMQAIASFFHSNYGEKDYYAFI